METPPSLLAMLFTACSSLLSACAAVGGSAPASPAQSVGSRDSRVDITLGYRDFDNDWSPIDEQGSFGVEYSRMFGDGRYAWGVGTSYSSEEKSVTSGNGGIGKGARGGGGVPLNFDLTRSLWQVDVGVRMFFTDPDNTIRPYVGAGLAVVQAKAEGDSSASEDDTSLGGLLRAGVDFRITDAMSLGLEARTLLGTDIDLGGGSLDADYLQIGFVIGFVF